MNENKPPNEDGFFAGIRKSNLIRSRQRWIGGVSSAVADRTRLDLTLVRGLFIITALFGVGFLAYGAAWLLLPEEGTGTILAEDASRGRVEGPLIAAGIFLIIGFWAPFNIGNWAFGSWLLIPNGIGIAITVIVLLVVFSKNSAAGHPLHQNPKNTAARAPLWSPPLLAWHLLPPQLRRSQTSGSRSGGSPPPAPRSWCSDWAWSWQALWVGPPQPYHRWPS